MHLLGVKFNVRFVFSSTVLGQEGEAVHLALTETEESQGQCGLLEIPRV